MFELSIASRSSLSPSSSLFRTLKYGNTDEQNYVHQVFGLAQNKNARVHVLQNQNSPYGFVALSVKPYNDVPSIVIEYLFTSFQFRGQIYEDLGETPLRISQYLLGHAIQTAIEVSAKIPLRYIVLQAVEDYLVPFYSRHGFSQPDRNKWMSMVIPAA